MNGEITYTEEEIEYNTWLVNVNLDNEKSSYDRIKCLGEQLLACDDYDFKVIIKTEFSYHDSIIWEAVDFQKVKENIAELI